MYGYDAPEMKPPLKVPDRENIISNAKKARDFLSGLILDKVIYAERIPGTKPDQFQKDKYGRILVRVHTINSDTMTISPESINDTMIQ